MKHLLQVVSKIESSTSVNGKIVSPIRRCNDLFILDSLLQITKSNVRESFHGQCTKLGRLLGIPWRARRQLRDGNENIKSAFPIWRQRIVGHTWVLNIK